MDVALQETLNGGDFIIDGNDLFLTSGIFNQVYLALFGGNVAQTTQEVEGSTEFRKDWWGNGLLFPDSPDNQFNSKFERELFQTPISTGGIQRLEAIAKEDLAFLSELGTVQVSIEIVNDTTIKIGILVTERENLTNRVLIFLWDGTKAEPIVDSEGEFDKINQSPWILEDGTWNDQGVWSDDASWID